MHGFASDSSISTDTDSYGSIAGFYDEMYAWRDSIDLQFFLSCADRPAMRILELGCGTGRISLPLARAGHSVTALDLSVAMLERMQEKLAGESAEVQGRITVQLANMTDFELGEQFDLVLIPFRAFQHLLTTQQQRSCLGCIRRHMAQDAKLVLDLFDPCYTRLGENAAGRSVFREDLQQPLTDGGLLRRYSRIVSDTLRQLNTVNMRFERLDSSGRIIANGENHMAMRWSGHIEMLLLLELCGLAAQEVYSGYDGSKLEQRCGDLIYICRRSDGQ